MKRAPRVKPMEFGCLPILQFSLLIVHTSSFLLHHSINMYRTTAGKAAEADELKTKPVRLTVRGRGMARSAPLP